MTTHFIAQKTLNWYAGRSTYTQKQMISKQKDRQMLKIQAMFRKPMCINSKTLPNLRNRRRTQNSALRNGSKITVSFWRLQKLTCNTALIIRCTATFYKSLWERATANFEQEWSVVVQIYSSDHYSWTNLETKKENQDKIESLERLDITGRWGYLLEFCFTF